MDKKVLFSKSIRIATGGRRPHPTGTAVYQDELFNVSFRRVPSCILLVEIKKSRNSDWSMKFEYMNRTLDLNTLDNASLYIKENDEKESNSTTYWPYGFFKDNEEKRAFVISEQKEFYGKLLIFR